MKNSSEGIKCLIIDGLPCSDLVLIKDHIVDYYDNLFKNTQPPDPTISNRVLTIIPACVSTLQNMALTCIPSSEEIKHTVFELSDSSAPGPDGFTGKFYHSTWDIIGQDVIDAVMHSSLLGVFRMV